MFEQCQLVFLCRNYDFNSYNRAMSLADNLKRIRTDRGMSQAALAKAANVTQQSISQLERGIDKTSKYLPGIARTLGVSVHELDPSFLTPSIPDQAGGDWQMTVSQTIELALGAGAEPVQIIYWTFQESLRIAANRAGQLAQTDDPSSLDAAQIVEALGMYAGANRRDNQAPQETQPALSPKTRQAQS